LRRGHRKRHARALVLPRLLSLRIPGSLRMSRCLRQFSLSLPNTSLGAVLSLQLRCLRPDLHLGQRSARAIAFPNRSLGNGSMQTCRHDPDQSFLSELSESRARHRDRETDQEKHHRPHRQQGILSDLTPHGFRNVLQDSSADPKVHQSPKVSPSRRNNCDL